MTHLGKAVRGSSVLFVLGVISYFLAYLTRVILARSLTVEQYGLFYAVLSLIVFSAVFRDMGLGTALVKFIPEYEVKKDFSRIKTFIVSAFSFQLLFALVLVSVFLIFSKSLAINYFKDPSSLLVLRLLLIYLISTVLFLNTKAILRGFQNITWFSLADPLKNLLTLLLLLAFFKMGLGILAAVYAYVLAGLLAFLILLVPLSKYFFVLKSKMGSFRSTTKQLFGFSVPVIFTGIGDMVVSYIDVLLLTYFASLTAVGIYNVILPTAMMFLFFGRAVMGVFFPMVSELWSKGEKVKIRQGLKLIYTHSFLFVVPILLAVGFFGREFITAFFGADYATGTAAFRILLLGVLFYIIAQSNHSVISAIGKPAVVTKIILTIAAVNFGLNLILIPKYGITGAAVATMTSYLLALLLSSYNLNRFVPISLPWTNWIKVLLSGSVVLAVFTFLINLWSFNIWLEVLIALIVSVVLYTLLVFVLKVIRVRDVKIILRQTLFKS